MELICPDEEGFRPVNDREADALIFTFAKAVGDHFIRIIKIEYDPTLAEIRKKGRVRTDREIKMRSEYNPENLRWLGIFIHEAAHIWQRETKRHRTGESGKNYRYSKAQVRTLNLEREQHARAVQDWFYVNYGIKSGLIGGKNQVDGEWVWNRVMKNILGSKTEYQPEGGSGLPNLRWVIDFNYDRLTREVDLNYDHLMREVQNPDHLPPTD